MHADHGVVHLNIRVNMTLPFKAFSFMFLPTTMHIIQIYFKYVFNNWYVQHQDSSESSVCI